MTSSVSLFIEALSNLYIVVTYLCNKGWWALVNKVVQTVFYLIDCTHIAKHPQNKGKPPPPPPSSTISKAKPRRMKMGMGGALNGKTNSILTNNDDRSIYGLSFMKRTSQNALVLLVNQSANNRPTHKGFCITQYHMV